MVNFPAPVGGTPLPADFAPSILFAVLYALLTPLMLYRMFSKRSRTTLLIGTVTFSVERVVIFSLRALQSRNESHRLSPGLTTYMQISFGMGFIGIANDIVNLVRCLLVNPTFGPETYAQSPAAASKGGVHTPPPQGTPDLPKVRQGSRRFTGIMALSFLAAIVPGIIANSNYSKVFNNQNQADSTAQLRVASTAVALAFTIILFAVTLWGKVNLPLISNRGVVVTTVMTVLITIIAIYRLAVMGHRTVSLTAPSPLDTPGGKAAFYVLHVLPEWLTTLILFGDNMRKTYGTGPFGDYRIRDETEAQRKKREAKEAEKEAKKIVKTRAEGDPTTASDPLLREKKRNELIAVRESV
ncbi:hypothetical protein BDZ97DRAFT_1787886 [Flammula alnicola]|nr:hypothetical protein BDZ97DRAFT_1787886 [Flammula alnicola]